MKITTSLTTTVLAVLVAGTAHAAVIEADDVDTNTGIGGPLTFTADGDLAHKVRAGEKGLGVKQQTKGEIDIRNDNKITVSRTDGASFGLASTTLAFLYDGPEFGDVQERAKITGELTDGSQSEIVVENSYSGQTDTDFNLYVDGSMNNSLITNTYPSTKNTAGLVDLGAVFGNKNLNSITYSATSGDCGTGQCNNQSDYSIASVNIKAAVPEPGTLGILAMGLLGLGLRFSRD